LRVHGKRTGGEAKAFPGAGESEEGDFRFVHGSGIARWGCGDWKQALIPKPR
jgi:hypothetical protein